MMTPNMQATVTDRYWATVETDKLGPEMTARIRQYYQFLAETGRQELYRRANRVWYGHDADGGWKLSSAVTYGGERGELVGARANHARALGQQMLTLTIGKRLAASCRASNDSPESMEQAILADSLVQHDREKTQLEPSFTRTVERAIRFGEGGVYQFWDEWAGAVVGQDERGRPAYAGDVRTVPKTPLEVVRDSDAEIEGDAEPQWLIVRSRVNRWEALARYGTTEEADATIRNAPTIGRGQLDEFESTLSPRTASGTSLRDAIFCWELYHLPTPAIPEGRYALMIESMVLRDGPMPYEHMPVQMMVPDVEEGLPFGYATFWDLLALQALYDSALSTAATNHDTTGLTPLWTPTGDMVETQALASGQTVLHSAQKPEALNLNGNSEATYKLREMVKNDMELISGINATQRGEPSENLRSGAALALIQARAVEFMASLNTAYARMIERTLSARIGIWKRYVTADRVYEIAGPRAGMWAAASWSGKKIENVTRVVVELADPVSQTAQGRKLLADEWVKVGWIKSPDQYALVLATGRADPFLARPRDVMRQIAQENEALRQATVEFDLQGVPLPESLALLPQVMMTDAHSIHIREHACLLDDPQVRQDPNRVAVVMEHINAHAKQAKITDPLILTAVGEQVPPDHIINMGGMAQPGSAPAPNDAADKGGGAPPTGAPNASEQENPQVPAPAGASADVAAKMPRMPKNPATGERAPLP